MVNVFNYGNINTVEFGVCIDTDDGEKHFLIPIDNNVKNALKEMLLATREALGLTQSNARLDTYQPSEKYASVERLTTPLDDSSHEKLKEIYNATNIPTDPDSLNEPAAIVYYFSIFHDRNQNKLFAIKKATQFRGIVKSRKFIVQFINETLKIVEDKIFRLDRDFDYYICDNTIFILRVNAFESTSDMIGSILAKASENAQDLGRSIKFLECQGIADFVLKHTRAARILASIRSRKDLAKTSLTKLKKECNANKIKIKQHKGKIFPEPGYELDFLQMLDRRRFNVALTDDGLEYFEATGRRNVS